MKHGIIRVFAAVAVVLLSLTQFLLVRKWKCVLWKQWRRRRPSQQRTFRALVHCFFIITHILTQHIYSKWAWVDINLLPSSSRMWSVNKRMTTADRTWCRKVICKPRNCACICCKYKRGTLRVDFTSLHFTPTHCNTICSVHQPYGSHEIRCWFVFGWQKEVVIIFPMTWYHYRDTSQWQQLNQR